MGVAKSLWFSNLNVISINKESFTLDNRETIRISSYHVHLIALWRNLYYFVKKLLFVDAITIIGLGITILNISRGKNTNKKNGVKSELRQAKWFYINKLTPSIQNMRWNFVKISSIDMLNKVFFWSHYSNFYWR